MFHTRLILFVVILLGAGVGVWAQEAPILYYPLDEGRGQVAADTSGNKLDGVVSADWTDSPSGKALSFDGQPAGIIKVELPVEKRFGKDSWTFSAWVKPRQFTIDDPQNQRRLFAFGTYPDAYLVIDILSTGQLSFYFCYRPGAADVTIAAGGSSAARLKTNQWAHVALVCDRKAGQVEIYINGFGQGTTALSPDFAGDFFLGGELTLGSGWHNYCGLNGRGEGLSASPAADGREGGVCPVEGHLWRHGVARGGCGRETGGCSWMPLPKLTKPGQRAITPPFVPPALR